MSTRCPSCCVAIVFLPIALLTASGADQSGNVTLAPNSFFNLDTGELSSTGGDVLWTGTALVPQGRAGLYNLGKHGSRVFKLIPSRYASAAPYSAAPIPADKLVVGDVFGVHTNGGRYSKVMVTAATDASLALNYTTFRGALPSRITAAGGAPMINQIQNNYSFLVPGVPNYGIAPGSLFVIVGAGLSNSSPPALQSSAPPGLPLTLNQTSVSVTVNGVATTPALYYTSANQLAAVLPSNTPPGDGMITVTYNGTASAPAPIHVVPTALGLDSLYGSGTGAAVATTADGKIFGLTNSAMPGQTIILWGSGIGGDTSSDDRTFPQNQNNLANIPLQVFFGGVSANVLYHGRSQFPGIDQINVVIPADVPTGCYVSVVAQSGSIVSNAVTLPVNSGGGQCSDPATGMNGTQFQTLASTAGGQVTTAGLGVGQFASANGNVAVGAVAAFTMFHSIEFGAGYAYASEGSCTVSAPGFSFSNIGVTGPGSGLDPGTVQVTGPAGSQMLQPQGGGLYFAQFAGSSLTPGAYTFSTNGGKDVRAVSVPVNVATPFMLTNKPALSTIDRSQGVTVTWSGGFPGGIMQVGGSTGSPAGGVAFACYAPSSAGQLTVPPSILLALPPGSGKLDVLNLTSLQNVPGVNFSVAAGIVSFTMPATYK